MVNAHQINRGRLIIYLLLHSAHILLFLSLTIQDLILTRKGSTVRMVWDTNNMIKSQSNADQIRGTIKIYKNI